MTTRRALLIALLILIADQATKELILGNVTPDMRLSVQVMPFVNLTLVWNRGISFGMFARESAAGVLLLVLLALSITAVLANWLQRAENGLTRLSIGLIMGGAVGNVIDRFRFGAVVDFIDLHVKSYHWPAFNVADAAICIGVALLILESILSRPSKDRS